MVPFRKYFHPQQIKPLTARIEIKRFLGRIMQCLRRRKIVLKQQPLIFDGDSGTGIPHLKANPLLAVSYSDLDLTAIRCILNRVSDEAFNNLVQHFSRDKNGPGGLNRRYYLTVAVGEAGRHLCQCAFYEPGVGTGY